MTKLKDIICSSAIFVALFLVVLTYVKIIYSEFFLTRIFPFILAWLLIERIKGFMSERRRKS